MKESAGIDVRRQVKWYSSFVFMSGRYPNAGFSEIVARVDSESGKVKSEEGRRKDIAGEMSMHIDGLNKLIREYEREY